jgi:hypothetical protein
MAEMTASVTVNRSAGMAAVGMAVATAEKQAAPTCFELMI